jgi:hypothetical protein
MPSQIDDALIRLTKLGDVSEIDRKWYRPGSP